MAYIFDSCDIIGYHKLHIPVKTLCFIRKCAVADIIYISENGNFFKTGAGERRKAEASQVVRKSYLGYSAAGKGIIADTFDCAGDVYIRQLAAALKGGVPDRRQSLRKFHFTELTASGKGIVFYLTKTFGKIYSFKGNTIPESFLTYLLNAVRHRHLFECFGTLPERHIAYARHGIVFDSLRDSYDGLAGSAFRYRHGAEEYCVLILCTGYKCFTSHFQSSPSLLYFIVLKRHSLPGATDTSFHSSLVPSKRTFFSLKHLLNAFSPMRFTPRGIVMSLSL